MTVNNISSQDLGNLLQIRYDSGVRDQLSQEYEEYMLFTNQLRKGNAEGRTQNFYLQTGRGPESTQWQLVDSAVDFPTGRKTQGAEYSAVYKDIDTTVELEYNIWKRALTSPKYVDLLQNEIDAKADNQKRLFSAAAHLDGTGVILEADSAAISSGRVVVTASADDAGRGSIGACEEDDKLFPYTAAGAANDPTVSPGTFSHYRVVSKDRVAGTVTLKAEDSTNAELTVTATSIVDGDVFYRNEASGNVNNLSSIGSTDYNTLNTQMAGLESITADDGRVCHGITMSGTTGGSRYDAGGDPFDVVHIQRSLTQAKTRVGRKRCKWDSMLMAPEAEDALIEGRETDRRFQTWKDGIRGTDAFGYRHGTDQLEIMTTEFAKKNRVYMIPKMLKSEDRCIEFWGAPFEQVDTGGGPKYLKASSSGGYNKTVQMFFCGSATLLNKFPAAVNVIHNFTLPQ